MTQEISLIEYPLCIPSPQSVPSSNPFLPPHSVHALSLPHRTEGMEAGRKASCAFSAAQRAWRRAERRSFAAALTAQGMEAGRKACECSLHVHPPLNCPQLMRFLRRTEGMEAARKAFLAARKARECSFHVYVASAYMELCHNKESKNMESKVARNVFQLGMKKFGSEPGFVREFARFLSRLNDGQAMRELLQGALASPSLAPHSTIMVSAQNKLWEELIECEQLFGDLNSLIKVPCVCLLRRLEFLPTASHSVLNSLIPASLSLIPASLSLIPASLSLIPTSLSLIPASLSLIPASLSLIPTSLSLIPASLSLSLQAQEGRRKALALVASPGGDAEPELQVWREQRDLVDRFSYCGLLPCEASALPPNLEAGSAGPKASQARQRSVEDQVRETGQGVTERGEREAKEQEARSGTSAAGIGGTAAGTGTSTAAGAAVTAQVAAGVKAEPQESSLPPPLPPTVSLSQGIGPAPPAVSSLSAALAAAAAVLMPREGAAGAGGATATGAAAGGAAATGAAATGAATEGGEEAISRRVKEEAGEEEGPGAAVGADGATVGADGATVGADGATVGAGETKEGGVKGGAERGEQQREGAAGEAGLKTHQFVASAAVEWKPGE
ncbi:unnamed protein product [Closterium sp. NIES-65]|nr:unnamed protein product [Closterium sp. NIES-65]